MVGQFFGHQNTDTFRVFYNNKRKFWEKNFDKAQAKAALTVKSFLADKKNFEPF